LELAYFGPGSALSKTNGSSCNTSLRGGKYSLYDGGTHVPFMAKRKGKIKSGTSDALISQVDFLASFAAMTNQKSNAIDSENVLDALLGKNCEARKDVVVEEKNNMVYRENNWILIPPILEKLFIHMLILNRGTHPYTSSMI
jgi:arylsulfatase A-like enzyme